MDVDCLASRQSRNVFVQAAVAFGSTFEFVEIFERTTTGATLLVAGMLVVGSIKSVASR